MVPMVCVCSSALCYVAVPVVPMVFMVSSSALCCVLCHCGAYGVCLFISVMLCHCGVYGVCLFISVVLCHCGVYGVCQFISVVSLWCLWCVSVPQRCVTVVSMVCVCSSALCCMLCHCGAYGACQFCSSALCCVFFSGDLCSGPCAKLFADVGNPLRRLASHVCGLWLSDQHCHNFRCVCGGGDGGGGCMHEWVCSVCVCSVCVCVCVCSVCVCSVCVCSVCVCSVCV